MHSFKVVEKYVLQYACLFNLFPLGTLSLESGTGVHHSHDPLFQASLHKFTINAPLMYTLFSIFRKKKKKKRCIFSLVSGKISDLKTKIFEIFLHFSRKIRSLDPTFGNPCGTHPSKKKKKKKKVVCPPGFSAVYCFHQYIDNVNEQYWQKVVMNM